MYVRTSSHRPVLFATNRALPCSTLPWLTEMIAAAASLWDVFVDSGPLRRITTDYQKVWVVSCLRSVAKLSGY